MQIFVLQFVCFYSYAQLGDGAMSSPIFGESPINGGSSSLRDPNWGVAPSRQSGNIDMWGNTNRNNTSSRNRRSNQQQFDAFGNPLLTDRNGNVLYDAQGQPIIDSAAAGDPLLDPPSVTIPDDPNDVPLDGGVTILIMLALGIGYTNKQKLSKTAVANH